MIDYLLLGFGITVGVAGQFLLKAGANTANIFEQFLRPATIAGFVCYGLAGACYTMSLRSIPLSVAYPTVSASYIVVVVFAHFLWKEPLGLQQLAAVLLISLGIGLLYWKI